MTELRKIKISDLCTIEKGKIGIKKAIPGEYPLVVTAEKRLTCNEYHFDKTSVIIPLVSSTGHGHASLKRIHYQEGKFAVGSILCVVTPKDNNILDAYFLYKFLDLYKEQLLVSRMKGMANVTLPMKEIGKIEIPLISIVEQKKWINSFKITHRNITQFDTEITNQQVYLKKLRQTILQEAIQGKLTKEWRKHNQNVEPASELLKKIKAEKDKLIKEKKINKGKPLPPIKPDEIPFEIPETWQWTYTSEVCNYIVDCPHSTPKFIDTGYNCIDTTCVNDRGEILLNRVRKVSINTFNSRNERLVPARGDIIYSREGSIGQAVILPDKYPACLGQRVMLFRPYREIPSVMFRFIVVSSFFLNKLIENHKGIGAKHVNMKDLRGSLIPLPPLDEQKEIVSRIIKLIKYCDELEIHISKTQKYSETLMQTVLKEAFER